MSSSFTWAQITETPVMDNMNEVEEDERMVEDLVIPSSPLCLNSPLLLPPSSVAIHQFGASQASSYCSATGSSSSSFPSTDPFYMAQSEATLSSSPRSHSAFAQFGLPSQQSAFLAQEPLLQCGEIHPALPPLPGYPRTYHDQRLSTP